MFQSQTELLTTKDETAEQAQLSTGEKTIGRNDDSAGD
jgi:hypothetical protein